MLAIGENAPDFTLPDQNNIARTLSQFLGKIVILYFYPKDDTPGCTKEACNFRDAISQYQALGAVILGVSRDSVTSHLKFHDKNGLNFDLLADESGKVHELYGVIQSKTIFGKTILGTVRTTYLIDTKGKIIAVYPNVKVDSHNDELLTAVKTLTSNSN